MKPDNLHRTLNVRASHLVVILCHREQQSVGAQLTLSYDRRQIILKRNAVSEQFAGKHVEMYDFADRLLELRWKNVSLPYRVFSKDQRVSRPAIVENKRLGQAVALVKAQQDLKRETKVLTNSEKTGYKKRPHQPYGPDYIELLPAPKAVKMPV